MPQETPQHGDAAEEKDGRKDSPRRLSLADQTIEEGSLGFMEMWEPDSAENGFALYLKGTEAAVVPEAGLTVIQGLEEDNVDMVGNTEENVDCNNSEEDGDAEREADDDDYFFPTPEEVEGARAPEVGMVFATVHEARRFVSCYGQVAGFAVIIGRNYKHKKITFQCKRSRKMREVDDSTRKRKKKKNIIERSDCRMSVMVKRVDGQWRIARVDNEHNHPLTVSPSLIRFFVSHRYMSDEERSVSRVLQESRIKPIKIMQIFEKLGGRFKNIPCRKMDANNLKQPERRGTSNTYIRCWKIDPNNLKQADKRVARNSDIESALKHFRRLQKEQPGFYYAVKIDEENTIRSIFWTNAHARLDYALYGDFISFHTTYGTNRHNMPFAPIIGINGQGKTTAFGWALLEDEEADTFSWLFKTFLDVMDAKKPSVIITDQGPAMRESIALVFPTVFHRFCMRCVTREATEVLGGFTVTRPGMEAELTHLVTNSLTAEEFENGWQSMVQKYDAASDALVQLMFETRSMWVPLYFKHVFCPFMLSTGCNESTLSIFKCHVPGMDSIEAFIRQYEIFQEETRSDSTVGKPMYRTRQPIERHASAVYTMGCS